MLSRVAENLYWLARTLSAQNTARLIRSYNHLIMDITLVDDTRGHS